MTYTGNVPVGVVNPVTVCGRSQEAEPGATIEGQDPLAWGTANGVLVNKFECGAKVATESLVQPGSRCA